MGFPANYDGVCSTGCAERIHRGDDIEADGDGGYRHVSCAPKRDPLTIAPGEVVCPDCFLIRPCPCLDR
jgi:hypothetical protein